MTPMRSLEQTLLENLPWNKARIKFVTRFLLALYAVQTVNLANLATVFSGTAKEESNYKRLQRFLREFEVPYAQLAQFVVKFLVYPDPIRWPWIEPTGKLALLTSTFLTLSDFVGGIRQAVRKLPESYTDPGSRTESWLSLPQ